MKKHVKKMSLEAKMVITFVIVTAIIVAAVSYVRTINNKKIATAAMIKNTSEEKLLKVDGTDILKEELARRIELLKAMEEESEEEETPEETVTYQEKEIKIPKSKVAEVNSAEDGERNKKNGGETVKQEQANKMFENEGTHSNGIDVSAHQGVIDWKTVADSGVDFAMIRCGFRGQTKGSIYEDKYFKTNVREAAANGIKIGIYFYSTAINETEALEEAAWVVKKIGPYRITYPVVYDFEDFENYRCSEVNGERATENALAFLNYVKSYGYEPMMYANKYDITNRMSRSSFNCKFWLAHYTSQTNYKGNFNMWQYTSKGSVPGISGNVDMNVAYFSYGAVAAPKHTHDYVEEVKDSFVDSTCTEKGSRTFRCSCGDTETKEVPLKDHDFGEWYVETEATEDHEGLEKRKCKNCDKEESRKIEKIKNNTLNNTVENEVGNSVNENEIENLIN